MTSEEKLVLKVAMFYGSKDSPEFKAVNLVALRDGFLNWGHEEASGTPRVVIGGTALTDFDITRLEEAVEKEFAHLHVLNEESWLKIEQKRTALYIQAGSASCT